MNQSGFTDLEARVEKRITWRECFLAKTEHVVPWPDLVGFCAPAFSASESAGDGL